MITDIKRELDSIVLQLLIACFTSLYLLIQEIASGHWKTISAGDSFGLSATSHGLYFKTIHDVGDRLFSLEIWAKDPQKLVDTKILKIYVDIPDLSDEISISCKVPDCPESNLIKINMAQQIIWRTLHERHGISVIINGQESAEVTFDSCGSLVQHPDYEAFRSFSYKTEQPIEFLVYKEVETSLGEF